MLLVELVIKDKRERKVRKEKKGKKVIRERKVRKEKKGKKVIRERKVKKEKVIKERRAH